MKKNLISLFVLVLLVGCGSTSTDKNVEIINNARNEVIKLNQKCNELFNSAASEYMQGDVRWKTAVMSLQDLTLEIVAVNKSLKIDCKSYSEDGEPIMLQQSDGTKSPMEGLPNELRIEE